VTQHLDDTQSEIIVGRGGLLVTLSGQQLLALCALRGWSLSELAARAKVSRPTLRSALLGHPVRPRTAWKLTRAVRDGPSDPDLDDLIRAA
jgi:transcriptional regulator with XRE-family HTH domain